MQAFTLLNKYITDKAKNEKVDQALIDVLQDLFTLVRPDFVKYNPFSFVQKNTTNIILTMTTCKRLDLFKQTINSIINTWTDLPLIDRFIIVDDNSSDDDRQVMKDLYPFSQYIMKNDAQKGHLQSMNIIYDILKELEPNYWIHIEDDFLFFNNMPYVTLGIQGLSELTQFNVKQIMFNRNYSETISQINMSGHIPYSNDLYSLHDYKPNGQQCTYWPYFSFRPSIIDVSAILNLGNFDSKYTFFENEYAKKWLTAGYKTGFFNMTTNIHIGRLCNKTGLNAYALNNVPQFNGQKVISNIKVINMYDRVDRLKNITKLLADNQLSFDRFEAIDGKNVSDLSLFKNNDFGYRSGFIGCALSHYYLWKQLVESNDKYYIIMEDDVTLCSNFRYKLEQVIDKVDLLFLGYHMRTEDPEYSSESDSIIQNINKNNYIGGTHCYYISRNGAQSLLDFIEINGIKHGIDYLMVHVQKILTVHETKPFLTFAEWVHNNNQIDSDIQYNYSVPMPKSDTYIFLESLDQIGHDCFVAEKYLPKSDYALMADSIETCVAFNTLGYFKDKIDTLTRSPYFSNNDGIYINKDYYFNTFKKKE